MGYRNYKRCKACGDPKPIKDFYIDKECTRMSINCIDCRIETARLSVAIRRKGKNKLAPEIIDNQQKTDYKLKLREVKKRIEAIEKWTEKKTNILSNEYPVKINQLGLLQQKKRFYMGMIHGFEPGELVKSNTTKTIQGISI